MIPALGRHRKVHLCEFQDSLVYKATQRNPVSKNQEEKRKGGQLTEEGLKSTHTEHLQRIYSGVSGKPWRDYIFF